MKSSVSNSELSDDPSERSDQVDNFNEMGDIRDMTIGP